MKKYDKETENKQQTTQTNNYIKCQYYTINQETTIEIKTGGSESGPAT